MAGLAKNPQFLFKSPRIKMVIMGKEMGKK